MRKRVFLLLSFTICISSLFSQTLDIERQLKYCSLQVHRALDELKPYQFNHEPRNILNDDKVIGWNLRTATSEEWCSGFWPGILWMIYGYTHDDEVRKAAVGYTEVLHDLAYRPVFDHDLGFLIFCSYGKGYEFTQHKDYQQVIFSAADTLATLFNPMVGTFLSWPRNVKMFGGHNTIMDNMMNLEMLFWVACNGGNPLLYDLAVQHAKTTMQHHFRPDGSCYHVAVYDSIDGHFIKGVTHQGYSDSSMWSRGQAWAIYGYTMVYRYTRNPVFLQFAQKVSDIYLRRLHETSDDMVPLWDMDAPQGLLAPKDASAACIVADALLELQNYVEGNKGDYYRQEALRTLACLSTDRYLSKTDNVAFLKHSTGNYPAGTEIDASIIYADYYYLEALLRARALSR